MLIEKYSSDLTIFILILIEIFVFTTYKNMTVHISFMISNVSSYIRLWVRIQFCDWCRGSTTAIVCCRGWNSTLKNTTKCLWNGRSTVNLFLQTAYTSIAMPSHIYKQCILLGNINAKLKWIIVAHATDIAILGLIQWTWKILKSDNFVQPTTSKNTVRKNKHMHESYISQF